MFLDTEAIATGTTSASQFQRPYPIEYRFSLLEMLAANRRRDVIETIVGARRARDSL